VCRPGEDGGTDAERGATEWKGGAGESGISPEGEKRCNMVLASPSRGKNHLGDALLSPKRLKGVGMGGEEGWCDSSDRVRSTGVTRSRKASGGPGRAAGAYVDSGGLAYAGGGSLTKSS